MTQILYEAVFRSGGVQDVSTVDRFTGCLNTCREEPTQARQCVLIKHISLTAERHRAGEGGEYHLRRHIPRLDCRQRDNLPSRVAVSSDRLRVASRIPQETERANGFRTARREYIPIPWA